MQPPARPDGSNAEVRNTPTTSTAHTAMAAGWFAGLVNVAVGHPFDTGKVRAQARMAEADGGLRPSQTSSKTGGKRPSAVGHAAAHRLQNAGAGLQAVRVLYRGIQAPLLTTGLSNALMFGSWRYFKEELEERECTRKEHQTTTSSTPKKATGPHLLTTGEKVRIDFVAGAGSGLLNAVVMFPSVCVKLRAQTTPANRQVVSFKQSVIEVLPWMTQPRTLLRLGYLPHLIQEGVGRGFYMATFTFFSGQCRTEWEVDTTVRADSTSSSIMLSSHRLCAFEGFPRWVAGGLAGLTGWTATYPCDVIRSRMQRDFYLQGGAAAGEAGVKASCWVRYGAQIYKAEGLGGLYRGLGFCVFRAIPVAICTLPAYDMCFNFLQG